MYLYNKLHNMFFSVEEYWEPKVDGLETIVVKRQIPVIHILLSTEEIQDTNQLGYVLVSVYIYEYNFKQILVCLVLYSIFIKNTTLNVTLYS